MELTIETIKARIPAVCERFGGRVAAVYLFGSRAAGSSGALSDTDLAVLLNPGERVSFFDLRFALYADFCRVLGTNELDLTVLNSLENCFILDEILRQGVLIYDGIPELRHDFEQKALHRVIDFKEQRRRVMGF